MKQIVAYSLLVILVMGVSLVQPEPTKSNESVDALKALVIQEKEKYDAKLAKMQADIESLKAKVAQNKRAIYRSTK